jgi:AraC family transcriptional regulator
MDQKARAYAVRFRRVLAHIEAHLDQDLSLERLSTVAAFSKFHFHRQFAALFGVSVHGYVQLVRLKRAVYQLAFRPDERIIDVALESGYESHEAFARAFKKAVGQTPSQFRSAPAWEPWHDRYEQSRIVRSQHMSATHCHQDVKIVDFPSTRVAALTHHGDPRLLGDTIREFIAWRRQNQLHPSVSATFNVWHEDPQVTPPEAFRMDLCAATDRPIPDNPQGVTEKVIPAGRCAVLRHVGSDDTLETTIRFLYAAWLPNSGEELRDFPLFFQRVRFFPDVPEHETIIDVFLPLR